MNKVVNTLVWCFVNDFQPLNSVPYLMCKLHSHIVIVFREVQQINLQLFSVLLLYQSGLGGGLFSNKRLSMFIIYCNRWWKLSQVPAALLTSITSIIIIINLNQLYWCNLTVYNIWFIIIKQYHNLMVIHFIDLVRLHQPRSSQKNRPYHTSPSNWFINKQNKVPQCDMYFFF